MRRRDFLGMSLAGAYWPGHRSVRYWSFCSQRVEPGEFQVAVRTSTPVTTLTFSPDAQCLIAASTQGVRYWRWDPFELIGELPSEIEQVHDVKFSPTGQRLAVVGGIPGEIGEMEHWDWATSHRLHLWQLHRDAIMRADWSPDGKQMATASFDGTCGVWESEAGQRVTEYPGHSKPVLSVKFWSQETLLSASVDHTIRVWQNGTGNTVRRLENHLGVVVEVLPEPGVAASRTRRMVSIGEDRTVRLWQPEIGRLIRFERLSSVPVSGYWDAGSESILVGCRDGSVHRLQQETLEVKEQLPAGVGSIQAIVVHPNTKQVVVAGETGISVQSGKE